MPELSTAVPVQRLNALNEAPLRPDRDYVLYWMTASRRTRHSFALDRACELARELDKPLAVLEALRVDYRWASDRLHRFVIDGMADQAARFAEAGVRYHPYVEPEPGAGAGLVETLAERAAAVVCDEWPCFFLRGLPAKVAPRLDVHVEMVDGCGLLPLRASDRVFTRAHSFRRHLQKNLAAHLTALPSSDPLASLPKHDAATLSRAVLDRWPATSKRLLEGALDELPIDHGVAPSPTLRGGESAARRRLRSFLSDDLDSYGDGRNHPDDDAASGLSPWLHFGQISSHEILAAIAERQGWTPEDVAPKATGKREGWWGMSAGAEAFLDELVTWREVGLNMCFHRDDYDQLESLPDWAKKTIAEHADDERPVLYDLDQLDAAETGDEIWNAAQRQLVRDGRMHNYLRMLWGKKIYGWSPSAADALDVMIELNNRYAVDGRDPNSYSGIFWVLGRYDRAWGPERPIFGKLRYMTSDSTRKKLRLKGYLAKHGA